MKSSVASQYGQGRESLIVATIDIVANRGLRGMTFRAVGEKAGVNNALIAHHFGNREGLLAASLKWTVDRAIASSALAEASEHPNFFRNALDLTSITERELLVFQYELILEASRNEKFREPVTALYQAYFRTLLPVETSNLALARARFAAFDGLVLQVISGAISHQEFEESIEAVTSLPWPDKSEPRPKD